MLSLLVLLSLVVIPHSAASTCVKHQDCDDIEEMLAAIASDPQNVQQLQKLFYPVNGASLSSTAIIVYFLNYTGLLPQQCDAGFYPWDSYPVVNTSYQEMKWYLWTTRVVNAIAPPLKILELGLYLPAVTFLLLFNQTCPLVQPTPIACLAVPYMAKTSMEMITIEVRPQMLQPESTKCVQCNAISEKGRRSSYGQQYVRTYIANTSAKQSVPQTQLVVLLHSFSKC